ncbi:class I SAM-dependent methyltransferase [Profundibacterium mesophilum]|uniref:Methyltransferase type 11 n=1 Tax=Profundibacterium mesophilum KAUST100406-0324 TaxID=1037889 RepID=A0A921NXU6_9RHOB|nr:class I SAM-dependent methyltransferase [Profundibacterium mesophilum]KAF0677336.1 Methyltransferase type 11 [Profundibacterium mesophilum KAUST100406-0324]
MSAGTNITASTNVTAGTGPARDAARGDGIDSGAYWRDRYAKGGTSGGGSYGRLAVFKAHVVNLMVHRHGLASLLELGSGDGANAELYAVPNYCGVDIAEEMVARCRARFADRSGWRFETARDFMPKSRGFDGAMSLDVIYHLVEDAVFEDYMRRLFDAARSQVLIYSSDHASSRGETAAHVRHRAYSDWIASEMPGWELVETIPQPYMWNAEERAQDTSLAFFRRYERVSR